MNLKLVKMKFYRDFKKSTIIGFGKVFLDLPGIDFGEKHFWGF